MDSTPPAVLKKVFTKKDVFTESTPMLIQSSIRNVRLSPPLSPTPLISLGIVQGRKGKR